MPASLSARPKARRYPNRTYSLAKDRARRRGIPFTLTMEWVRERIEAGTCELSGLPFSLSGEFVPSIDRIDASQGYTPENCRIVAHYVNRAINQFGEKLFERVAVKYLMSSRPELFVPRKSTAPPSAETQLDLFVPASVIDQLSYV